MIFLNRVYQEPFVTNIIFLLSSNCPCDLRSYICPEPMLSWTNWERTRKQLENPIM